MKQKLKTGDGWGACVIELLNIDCMEYMKGCKDNEFDLAIVDPPYGIGCDVQKESYNQGKKGEGRRHRKAWGKIWDKKPDEAYFQELFRVSETQIIWGGNYFSLPPTRCILMWDKVQQFCGSDFEIAWTSMNSASKSFRHTRIEAYSTLNGCGDVKIHPTQKPVKLYKWILTNYAKPGQRVLDTHLGSGSSAIAAHYYGVDFVGCEIDEDYYRAAIDRFNNETKQVAMF